MSNIKTFIFMDLESTGLSGPGLRPRVTELSLVAVHRNLLEHASRLSSIRVLDKLTLCVYPMKQIEPSAAHITGLHNDLLYQQKDFDHDLASLLRSFIARHEAPVCLIAHNGSRFDFPLMRSELQGIEEEFSPYTMCADSLIMFRDLDDVESNQSISDQSISDQSNVKQTINQNSADMSFKLKSDWNHIQTDVDKPISSKQTADLQSENPSSPTRKEINFLQSTPIRSNSLSQHDSHGGVKRKLEFVESNHSKVPKISSDVYQSHDNSHFLKDQQLKEETKLGNCGETESLEMGSSIPDELLLKAQAQFENDVTCDQSTSQSEQSENQSDRLEIESNVEGKPQTSSPKNKYANFSISDTATSSNTPNAHKELTSTATSQSVPHENCSKRQNTKTYSMPPQIKVGHENNSTCSDRKLANTNHSQPKPSTNQGTTSPSSKSAPPSAIKANNTSNQSKRPSYKLGDIYERVFGQRMREAHRAEDDCLALLRICQFQAERVIRWIDTNATPWSTVQPMYPPSPKKRRPLSPGHFPYHDAL